MDSGRSKNVAIVIPAYNEESVIGGVLRQLPKNVTVRKQDYAISIIVIDDGSTDKTVDEVKRTKHVQLISHVLNSGAGAATRTGLRYARQNNFEYAITMDSDGQHSTKDVVKLIVEITKNNTDLIIGSRLVDTKGMPWYRVLGNKGLSFVTFLVFGVFVRDSQSGLRAFNRKALSEINFRSDHYAFCSEVIWVAHRKKLRIKEVPITAIYSEYSLMKGQKNWGAILIIRQIVKRRLMSVIHG